MNADFLIIGSGIAGLSLAIKLSEKFPEGKIIIATKSKDSESNTRYAQGGIAVVQNPQDSFEKHIQDTLVCGDGLCDENVVRMVVENGPKRLQELIDWGAEFDKNKNELDLGKEGGHSESRVVHSKDQTGYEIERVLVEKAQSMPNIEILEYHFAVDLLVENNRCYGAIVLNERNNQHTFFHANYTILATGGIGRVYGHTTNPRIATADGIAMAHRAGATITEVEFIQFHPTALYSENIDSTFLISEAVRGYGACLRTKDGEKFMEKYHPMGDLAPRDIVSQSIEYELKKSNDHCVYIDCTHLDMPAFKKHFPMIYDRCISLGIDPAKNWIPVAPSQHYICGGIMVDINGATTVKNLFGCGECTRTGLHGANRLASNSLLEALVYSEAIFQYLSKNYKASERRKLDRSLEKNDKSYVPEEELVDYRRKMQQIMLSKVGIVRTDSELIIAEKALIQIFKQSQQLLESYSPTKSYYELQNMLTVGLLIVRHSLLRNENRGGFVKV